MTQAAKKKLYSAQEYFALEEVADYKSEYYDGEIFVRDSASISHNRITRNLYAACNVAFLNGPCEAFTSDMKVQLKKDQRYTYPDISIVCGEVRFAEGRKDTITNPTVVVEVLSPSTERFDRTKKFNYYRALESVQEYILVSQDRAYVETFYKEDNKWIIGETYNNLSETLKLHAVELEIPLSRIYNRVELLPEPPEDESGELKAETN